jgi:hypothetical protein
MLLTLLTACSDESEEAPVTPEGEGALVPVQLVLNGYYNETSTLETRGSIADQLASKLTNDLIRYFADSTSLWILIEKQVTVDGKTQWQAQDLNTAYAAITSQTSGSTTSDLIPCTVDNQGHVTNLASSMLYLQEGTYRLRALSPALPLSTVTKGGTTYKNVVHFENGTRILSNYDALAPAAPVQVTIVQPDGTNKGSDVIQRIELNPLVHQTARLHFNITADNTTSSYVYSIRPMSVGCEISGLQSGDDLIWTADEPEIHLYMNGKTGKLSIPDTDFTISADGKSISCDVDIIPTSMESTPLSINFNLRVNNVPTQFTASIIGRVFDFGYQYNYNVKITMDGKVQIADWNNSASSTEVDTGTNTPATNTSTVEETHITLE